MKPDVKNLQPGSYTVNSKILLESGTVLDEKTATFTVKTDYIPPITEASITPQTGNSRDSDISGWPILDLVPAGCSTG